MDGLVEKVRDAVLATTFGDGDCLQDYLGMMSNGDGGKEDGELIARAAIEAVFDEVERHLSAVQYDPAPYTAMKHRLATLRKQALG